MNNKYASLIIDIKGVVFLCLVIGFLVGAKSVTASLVSTERSPFFIGDTMPKGMQGFQKGNTYGKGIRRDGKNNPMYGKRHPSWQGEKPHCKDCGKLLSKHSCIYCIDCSKKKDRSPCWKGGKPKCKTCGKEIDYRATYCKKCYHKLREKKRIKVKCLFCNKIFFILPSYLKYRKAKFCSKKCKGKWMSKNRVGKNNPIWIDGRSYLPYPPDFNQQLKDRIRVRDNFICQKCGVPELECDTKLDIHHIDYNKENCREDNLISLCRSCNSKVNNNRKHWTNYFKGGE